MTDEQHPRPRPRPGPRATKAQIKSVGVVEAHTSRVVVLVLLEQTTSSKSTKTPRLDGSRVRVRMRPCGGTWLVAELTPI